MSYDISLTIDTGGKARHEIVNFNHTSNVFGMYAVAFSVKKGIKVIDRLPANEAEFHLNVAIRMMDADPSFFRTMNPSNGWGDSLSAYQYLVRIAAACKLHPRAIIEVSA